MCKVLMVSGIKPNTRKKALAFMKEMADPMSAGNKDGLGYAAIDSQGKLFGERWLENKDAFAPAVVPSNYDLPEIFKGALSPETVWNNPTKGEHGFFGLAEGETVESRLNDVVAFTLHTRYATSAKGFKNVHPFVDVASDTSLIHNGVIRNEKDFKLELSTCDSEAILISYLQEGVNLLSSNAQRMSDKLIGYYACGIFSRDADGNRILDIFKGNGATLTAFYIKELETLVFCTSATDVEGVCRKLGFEIVKKFAVNDGYLMRFNPYTGEAIDKQAFTPGKEWSYNSNSGYSGYSDLGKTKGETGTHGATGANNVCRLPSNRFKKKENLTSEQLSFLSLAPSVQELDTESTKSFLVTNHVVGE